MSRNKNLEYILSNPPLDSKELYGLLLSNDIFKGFLEGILLELLLKLKNFDEYSFIESLVNRFRERVDDYIYRSFIIKLNGYLEYYKDKGDRLLKDFLGTNINLNNSKSYKPKVGINDISNHYYRYLDAYSEYLAILAMYAIIAYVFTQDPVIREKNKDMVNALQKYIEGIPDRIRKIIPYRKYDQYFDKEIKRELYEINKHIMYESLELKRILNFSGNKYDLN